MPDRSWVPALAAGVLALAFVGALLVRAGGDASLLVHAGGPCTTESAERLAAVCAAEPRATRDAGRVTRAPSSLTVQAADEAFDGQFFYRLGVSPWSTDGRVAGVQFDLPALRNARWGYGAVAFVASGGDADLVPWALVGLNVLAAAVIGGLGGALARSSGRHAAWGLLLALWPGFAYSLSLDTSELVASAFLLAGLLALRRRRWLPAAAALAAAVLTRDTTAVVPFGLAVAAVWAWSQRPRPTPARRPDHVEAAAAESAQIRCEPLAAESVQDRRLPGDGSAPVRGAAGPDVLVGDPQAPSAADHHRTGGPALLLVGLVPLVVFSVWQLVQRARFGALPLTSSGDNNLAAPFAGLVTELRRSVPPGSGAEAFRLLGAAGLVALIAAAAWCWRSTTTPAAERIAWLPAVLVVVMLNDYLWSGATAFARAATEAGLLSVLVILGSGRRTMLTVTAAGLAGLWLLTAASQVAKLG